LNEALAGRERANIGMQGLPEQLGEPGDTL
jgi:hypothetical protein